MRFTTKKLFVCLISLLLVNPALVHAQQCVNPERPNCDFYSACMESTCKCGFEASGYALSYGKKYCTRFLSEQGFSTAGNKWRDATLRCLQEKLVGALPRSPQGCSCSKLRDVAFTSHVFCYTQPGASVCDLPAADVLKIKNLVDDSDKTDIAGLKTILQVAAKCVATNKSNAWKIVRAYISEKLKKI